MLTIGQSVPVCSVCGLSLGHGFFVSAWERPFWHRHGSAVRCRGRTLPLTPPHAGRTGLCAECRVGAVLNQQDVKKTLPAIAEEIRAIGVHLRSTTHVRLVTSRELSGRRVSTFGDRLGMTLVAGRSALEIRVLEGLPRAQFGCVVAHETMHVLLAEREFPSHHPPSIEGICELLAYEWVRRQGGQPLPGGATSDPLEPGSHVRRRLPRGTQGEGDSGSSTRCGIFGGPAPCPQHPVRRRQPLPPLQRTGSARSAPSVPPLRPPHLRTMSERRESGDVR